MGATLLLGGAILLSGCHVDMWSQNKMKPYFESDFFSDRSELRPVVPGTVPHNGNLALRLDDVYMTGKDPATGKYVAKIPVAAVKSFAAPRVMLERGQDRFNAYCTPCHGYIGDGNGMITQRGLGYWQKLPASYYTARLRKIEDGYLYDVLVNGHGVMYGYGSRITDVNDRWAVVSYIRTLQLAHNASPSLAPAGAIKPGEAPVDTTMGNPELSGDRAEQPTPVDTTTGAAHEINRTPGGGNPGAANGISVPAGAAPDAPAGSPAPAASEGAQ